MTSTGLIVAAAVLVLGTAVGLWRRRTDGRLRSVGDNGGGSVEADDGSVMIAGVVPRDPEAADPSAAGQQLDDALLAALGVEPAAATLLQFSSAFCAPCRALRRVSAEVAALIPQVRHVEVDAESHLDAVRALGIWKTPTLLVLDADGLVVKRATGVPGKPQLIAVLGEILTGPGQPSGAPGQ